MYRPVMKVIVEGQEIELLTIGEAAKRLKRSVETLRAWERSNLIPKPMYKNKNVRLYHPLEIEVMKKVLRKISKGVKRTDKSELQKEMWRALAEIRKEIRHGSSQD